MMIWDKGKLGLGYGVMDVRLGFERRVWFEAIFDSLVILLVEMIDISLV